MVLGPIDINPDVSLPSVTFDLFFNLFILAFLASIISLGFFGFATYWKIFTKAGEPGWAIFVPFYNVYVLFKVAFGYGWFFLLAFVPIINIIMAIAFPFMLASAFGKGFGFGLGIFFLGFVFLPILAFGSSRYVVNRN